MKNRNHLKIFGAGISGLVAAIHLAKSGRRVVVYEKRVKVGGPPQWHPSVHQQVFSLKKTSEYIGIDLSPCFLPTESHIFHIFGRRIVQKQPKESYICVKGGQSGAIEHYLFGLAQDAGVEFAFEKSMGLDSMRDALARSCDVIAATGLEKETFDTLGIKHRTVQGFRAVAEADERPHAISCLGDYTGHEFAYVASSGKQRFALLFSRKGINPKNLAMFRRHLQETESMSFQRWSFSTGAVPMERNLQRNGIVLAGTLSGMIDPFYLNGISGALISGKIAGMYFQDPEKAIREFWRFTKFGSVKQLLQKLFVTVPFQRVLVLPILYANNCLKTVGVI